MKQFMLFIHINYQNGLVPHAAIQPKSVRDLIQKMLVEDPNKRISSTEIVEQLKANRVNMYNVHYIDRKL